MSGVVRNIGQGKVAKSNDNVLVSKSEFQQTSLRLNKYIGNIWKILFGQQLIKIAYKSKYTHKLFSSYYSNKLANIAYENGLRIPSHSPETLFLQ